MKKQIENKNTDEYILEKLEMLENDIQKVEKKIERKNNINLLLICFTTWVNCILSKSIDYTVTLFFQNSNYSKLYKITDEDLNIYLLSSVIIFAIFAIFFIYFENNICKFMLLMFLLFLPLFLLHIFIVIEDAFVRLIMILCFSCYLTYLFWLMVKNFVDNKNNLFDRIFKFIQR